MVKHNADYEANPNTNSIFLFIEFEKLSEKHIWSSPNSKEMEKVNTIYTFNYPLTEIRLDNSNI